MVKKVQGDKKNGIKFQSCAILISLNFSSIRNRNALAKFFEVYWLYEQELIITENPCMTPLLAIEKSRGKPILVLAREFADLGLTLKVMATELGINYRSLKQALGIRGYTHPRGIELVVKRIHSETGKNLAEYVQILITQGLSRNAIATKLKIDNKTLQSFANRESIVFAVVPSSPKNLTNIVHALLSRIPERRDFAMDRIPRRPTVHSPMGKSYWDLSGNTSETF